MQGSNLKLGSIAGEVESGSTVSAFSKVTGSLSSRSESLAVKNSSLTAGSLFGYADTLNADDTVSGYSEILKSLGDGSAQLKDNLALTSENGYLLTDNSTYRLSGFYDPLFIRDFTFDYDGSVKDYSSLMSSEAFRFTDYVSIEKDYIGLALEGGVYSHTLKSATSGRGFYFVDENGSASAVGKGLITIVAPEPETVPDSGISTRPDSSASGSDHSQSYYSYESAYETSGRGQLSYFSAGDGSNLQSPFSKVARCGFCQGR